MPALKRPIRRLALLTAILLGAGCAVGPDYESVLPSVPGQGSLASSDSEHVASGELPPDWWRLYEEPGLNAMVEEALVANTDLRAAEANLRRAEAVLRESRNQRLPATDLQATETYSRQNFFFGDEPLSVENNVYNANLSIAYQVDLFGRVRRAIEATRANAEAVRAAYHATQITVAAGTVRAYADACAAGYQLAVTEESLQLQNRSFELTENLRSAGRGTALDVAAASTQVAQTRALVPALKSQRQAALYRLAALMGREPGQIPEDASACNTPLTLSQVMPVVDGAQLLRRRPDVLQAERELAAATARVGVVVAELYPSVSFGGSWGSAALSGADLFSSETEVWSYGPTITWAFPNISGTLARQRQAEADVDAALARFDGAWLNALRETETALTAYFSELERQEALADASEHSGEAARLAQARFEAGQLNYLDVLQSELALTNARLNLADSQARVAALQVDLFLALGGGWTASAE